jgi:hypothetical protein
MVPLSGLPWPPSGDETISPMDVAELRRWCLAQGGTVEDFPFGPEHSVFKVGGKTFALSALDRTPLELSATCEPELAVQLGDSYDAIRPGYDLDKRTGTPSRSTAASRTSSGAN